MLFLDFQKLKRKYRRRQVQFLFCQKEGNDNLFFAPSTMQCTVLFEDGTIVRRHQEEDIQVGPPREKFSPDGTPIEQHAFQLVPELAFDLLHIGLQQLLYLARQSFDQTFSHARGPYEDIGCCDLSSVQTSGNNPAAIMRSIPLNGGIVRNPAVVDRT